MSTTLFLGPMSDHAGMPTIAKHGIWDRRTADIADMIAVSLPATGATIAQMARSIPSTWGYVRLFADALWDREHTLHDPVTELWRRFVALVALRRVLPPDMLKLEPIEIPELPPAHAAGIGTAASDMSFRTMAALQFPHELLGTTRGNKQVVVAVQHAGKAVGLLLPGLMAVPGRSLIDIGTCPDELRHLFPLSELSMPEDDKPAFYREYLTAARLGHVGGFLHQATSKAAAIRIAGGTHVQARLLDRLAEFEMDVRRGLHNEEPFHWRTDTTDFLPRIPEKSAIRLFGFEPGHPGGDGGGAQQATLKLRTDPEFDPRDLLQPVLVAIEATDPGYLCMRMDDYRIINDFRGNPVNDSDRPSKDRILLLTEDDLFAPCLIRLLEGEKFSKHGPEFERFLLPLQPVVLALMAPQTILQSLRVVSGSANSDQVTIGFKVSVGSHDPIELELTRTYRLRAERFPLVDAPPPDSLAIWPDFAMVPLPGKNHDLPTLVYQAQETTPAVVASHFRATSLITRAKVAKGLKASSRERSGRHTVQEILEGAPPSIMLDAVRLQRRHELMTDRDPVEAIQCECKAGSGLLLLHDRACNDAADGGLACKVAIDFGTSNTTLAFDFGDGPPQSRLEAHVWLPFRDADEKTPATDDALKLQYAYQGAAANFIPPRPEVDLPFQSLLQVRSAVGQDNQTLLLRSRIIFPILTVKLAEFISKPPEGTVVESNLKWAASADRRMNVRHFLRETILLAVGHARARGVPGDRIAWVFTKPKSLPTDVQTRFSEDVDAALREVLGFQAMDVSYRWESEAIFGYLVSHQIEAAAPALAILDVGGGSTDIALMGGRPEAGASHLLAHGSAEIAGRALLIDHWTRRWGAFQEWLKTVYPDSSVPLAKVSADDNKTAILESLLNDRTFSNKLEERCKIPSLEPLLDGTRTRVRFGFLGFIYFIVYHGFAPLLARRAISRQSPVSLFLCGRGSLIFKRFCIDPVTGDVMYGELIDQWLRSIGFVRPQFRITLSANPKQEVALGGLSDVTPAYFTPGSFGFAERSATFGIEEPSMSSAGTGPTTRDLLAFCKALPPEIAAGCPGLGDPGELVATIEGSIEIALSFPNVHPGFKGFDQFDTDPEFERERRAFMLGLKALLREWDKSGATA